MKRTGKLFVRLPLAAATLMICLLQTHNVALAATEQEQEPIKTGWTFGAVPAISYNSDLGFQYGALVNLFYFGDGSSFPKYMHSLYGEISRFTKGSGINRFFYDSEYLIPNLRVTSDLSFLTEQALDFYGFNGYDAVYDRELEEANGMFYRHDRRMFRFTTDFQGSLIGRELRWVAGFGILHNQVAPVDLEVLNEGRDADDLFPDEPGLYEKYVEWGLIGENEKDGGYANHLKLGLVYDTRDFEPHPMRGMWSEVVFFVAPAFLGNGDFGYTKISATHRQYFTLVDDVLSLAYRLNYQGTLSGQVPFFMQPYMIASFSASSNTDGLGGSKTLRGVLRNRVVGDAFAFGNAELRWKFLSARVLNQEVYLAMNFFADAGMVLRKIDVEPPPGMEQAARYFANDEESLHTTLGAGLKVVLNRNFIVSADFGRALDERDGGSGLYIGLNFLF